MGYSAKIIQRTDYIRSDGTASLYLRFTIDRSPARIPLDIAVLPDNFLVGQQKVKMRDKKEERDINLLIGKCLAKANDIFITYRLAEKKLTVKQFKKEWENPSIRNDLIHFIDTEIESSKAYFTYSTIKTYKTVVNHLANFTGYINFMDVNTEWVEKLDRWMKTKKKLGTNARTKYHKTIRKFIKLAIKRGVKIKDPYDDWKFHTKPGEIIYLEPEEVSKLFQIYKERLLPDWLHEDLRKFLFVCYTGPRYSDINEFNTSNIDGDYLIYSARKTIRWHNNIKVPLTKTAKYFLMDQQGVDLELDQTLFQRKAMQVYNRNLKTIASYASIRKNLTSHVARHTFATLFLHNGGQVETLRLLLGHSKIETTMRYVHVTDQRRVTEISGMERDDL